MNDQRFFKWIPRRAWVEMSAVGLYALAAALVTWPLAAHLSSRLYGDFLTDTYQTARHMWWIKHALQTGQSVFFQPALGYPEGLHGAWLWANPFEYFPGWLLAFAMPLAAAANLSLLCHLALNGWAMHRLVLALTGARGPALLAGLIFLAYPAAQGRIYGGHPGVLALWPVPLYLLALLHLRRDFSPRWTAAGAICWALGVAGNSTLLVYYLLPVTLVWFVGLAAWREWAWLRRCLPVTVIGGLLALILLVPLALETRAAPQYNPDIGESVRFSADLLAVAAPSFYHPLFESLAYPRRALGLNLVEGIGYVGMGAGLLALLGLWHRRAARPWLLLALIAWICSLGPLLKINDQPVTVARDAYRTYVALPWGFLQEMPILDISRTPGRFNLTVGLALAIMAGYGADKLWAARSRRWLVLLAAGLILFEYQSFWPMPHVEARVPQAVHDLARRDDIRAVFNVPWDDRIFAKHALYFQTVHQHPILTGHFIRDTPVNPARLNVLQSTLDPALLNAAGVDVVIVHRRGPLSPPVESQARAQLGQPIYEDAELLVFDVPEAGAAGFIAVTPDDSAVSDRADAHFYAPEAGWVNISGTLTADGRDVILLLDGVPVHRWRVMGETVFHVPLRVEAGYHTARLTLDLPCPRVDDAALACRAVTVRDVTLANFIPAENESLTRFGRGIVLEAAQLGTVQPGAVLPLRLWWRVARATGANLVRFVHVIGPDGTLTAQTDDPLNLTGAWMENPALMIPDDLAPGEYHVYVGWYTYPDVIRIPVEDGGGAADDNRILAGTFVINGDGE